jgi:hypothetical protein
LAARGKTRELTDRAIDRVAAWMIGKRRLKDAGLSTIYSNRFSRSSRFLRFAHFHLGERFISAFA